MKHIIHVLRAALLGLTLATGWEAAAQVPSPGPEGTWSEIFVRSPEYPAPYSVYYRWPPLEDVNPRTSQAEASRGFPDASRVTAVAHGATGFHSSPSPHGVTAQVSSYGSAQYHAYARAYSVSAWQPAPHASASMVVIVKPRLHGSVSVGGGTTLSSSIGDVFSEFEIYAAIYRLGPDGDYFVEEGMEFYTHGRLEFGNPMPLQLDRDGDLSDLDNWEETFDGDTLTFSVNGGLELPFTANGNSTYWVVVTFGAYSNVDKQGLMPNLVPITAAAEFGSTFTLEFEPVNPLDRMVPVEPRKLLVTGNAGTPEAPRLLVTGQPGGVCVLETSTDLFNWTGAATNTLFTGNWTVDGLSFDASTSRFFRVLQNFGP